MKNSTQLLCFSLAVGLAFIPALGVALRDMAVAMNLYEARVVRIGQAPVKTNELYAIVPLQHREWRLR